jgi:hypothetical protein
LDRANITPHSAHATACNHNEEKLKCQFKKMVFDAAIQRLLKYTGLLARFGVERTNSPGLSSSEEIPCFAEIPSR